jgi:hypothetical protein
MDFQNKVIELVGFCLLFSYSVLVIDILQLIEPLKKASLLCAWSVIAPEPF